MSDKIDKILEKVTQLQIDAAMIKKDSAQNTKDLAEHIKRTNLLEARMEQHAEHHEAQLEEALLPIRSARFLAKVAAGVTTLLAIFKIVKDYVI
jgi:hypothetical protein